MGLFVAHRRSRHAGSASRSQEGVTAIELLIVIAIVGVLAAVSAPSFLSTVQSMRQRTALATLLDDVNRAKVEAIKRNARVLVCARNAAGTDCVASEDWQAGWLVCTQDPANVNHCLAGTADAPNPLVVRPATDATLSLVKGQLNGLGVATEPVRFSANGSANPCILTLTGRWTGATSRVVTIEATGGITK
jgi:type IV fimbrial biogenesis protein FimT